MLSESAAKQSVDQCPSHCGEKYRPPFPHRYLGWQPLDRDADVNIVAIHRFVAPMAHGGRMLAVKFLVKELKLATEGNRIYTLGAVEVRNSRHMR